MPVPPLGHSSSIDSASSFNSSKSSLLALPLDEVSSQSDVADFVPSSSSMPRGDISAYGIAASPTHAASKSSQSSIPVVSATQKFKRAFGKRRRPSQGAETMLSSGDEHYTSDVGPSHPPFLHSSPSPTTSRPSMAMITHLIVGRKARDRMSPNVDQPPPLPPKPIGLHAPPTSLQVSTSSPGPRPRSSVMVTSPSINAAIEFMRADEERQRALDPQQESLPAEDSHASEESKERWRRSDSTMGSGHTVRPSPHDAGSGKRLSAFMSPTSGGGNLDLLEFLSTAPEPEGARQRSESSMGKQSKRRSLSLNIHVSSHSSSAPTSTYPTPISTPDLPSMPNPYSAGYSIPFTSSPLHTPIINTSTDGALRPGTASGEPVTKVNIRERLAAWTATSAGNRRSPSPLHAVSASTSSPSLVSQSAIAVDSIPRRRLPVASDASQPPSGLQVVAAFRPMQSRERSPSGSSISNPPGIRQAATSLTSGAGAKALGLGKRAYEKVGRVWGGSQGSGSGSDTPGHHHPNSINTHTAPQAQAQHHQARAPSAFATRRTPNAPSGTWSITSRSSSEREQNTSCRDMAVNATPVSPNILGRLVRPPKSTSGGVVFGRNLWECAKETRVTIVDAAPDSLTRRMIPALVYRCVQHLHKWGLEEEGLFRISGRSSHIARLRNEFDGGADYDITECSPSDLDPHAVASVFKAYLRELPEPILTRSLTASFEAAINSENSRTPPASSIGGMSKAFMSGGSALPSDPRGLPMLRKPPSLSTFTLPTSSSLRAPSASLIETLADLIYRLPKENRDLLQTVVELMKATAARSKETKMPLSNLLLVFCPSLSMAPTLLRVLCDVSSLWDPPPVIDISRVQIEDEDAESDVSTDYDSDFEDGDMVVLSSDVKGKGREMPIEDPASDSEIADPQTDDEVILLPHIRPPRPVRRIAPPSNLPMERSPSSLSVNRPFTPDTLLRSGASPSLDVPIRNHTPSPLSRSEASLNSPSIEFGSKGNATPRTQRSTSPAPSSAFIAPTSWGVMNQDKALPASPRSPTLAVDGAASILQAARPQAIRGSDHAQSTRSDTQPRTNSDPQLVQADKQHSALVQTLPSPLLITSRSAPNVAFPTTKTAPPTPTSVKKHALTLSLGRNPKLPDDDDVPSPSRRLGRRPSLNLLFNMKRNGPPSPRSRTPTISSPVGIPVTLDQAPWIATAELGPKSVRNALPPVLSLPIESGMDSGLGWDDVFGPSKETTVPPSQPRPVAISQPSVQTPSPLCPPSPGRRPTTEYLLSTNGFFSTNGPPVAFPSATAVLEAANSGAARAHGSPVDSSPVGYLEDTTSSGDDSPPISSPNEPLFSPAPHISFQLRRSSLEDEDWASAVLLAAGKPAESFA